MNLIPDDIIIYISSFMQNTYKRSLSRINTHNNKLLKMYSDNTKEFYTTELCKDGLFTLLIVNKSLMSLDNNKLLHIAAEYGSKLVLNAAYKIGHSSNKSLFNCFEYIVKYGHVHLFDWAMKKKYEWKSHYIDMMVEYGHLNVIKRCLPMCFFPGFAYIMPIAIKKGHLHIIRWIIDSGGNWIDSDSVDAALYGHKHILEYAKLNGYKWNENTLCAAIKYGDVSLVRYILDNS